MSERETCAKKVKIESLRRVCLAAVAYIVILMLVLFMPGGIGWWQGWVFLSVYLLGTLLSLFYIRRNNAELFVARSKIHPGMKPWDRIVVSVLSLTASAMFPIAGLDHRNHWSTVPLWLVAIGYILLAAGLVGRVWAAAVNKFAERGVRIQIDRGHTVVDSGPYRYVRHPFYVACIILYAGIALCLGSLWALIAAAVAAGILVARTALEDRTLQNELSGYKDYAERVRYRLFPGVW